MSETLWGTFTAHTRNFSQQNESKLDGNDSILIFARLWAVRIGIISNASFLSNDHF